MGHEVLYVVPFLTRLKSPSRRRVLLPEIDSCVRFETPGSLRDLQRIRGLILCEIFGSDLLDWYTSAAVQSRLSRDPHEGCPAAAVDFSRYVWL